MTTSSDTYATALALKWERYGSQSLTDSEHLYLHVTSVVAFMSGAKTFEEFFEIGFKAEDIAACLRDIGHPRSAATVLIAHRIYRRSSSDAALVILARAFCAMEADMMKCLARFKSTHCRGDESED
ncbi:MAG: hypothetical protein ABMA13_00870 [Chthoniobacteraceae bacterium]